MKVFVRPALALVTALGLAPSALQAHPGALQAHPGLRIEAGPRHPGPTTLSSFELVGHIDLGDGLRYGDVFFFDKGSRRRFAYVGTFVNFESNRPCGRGVKIFDVTRPRRPRLVGTAKGFNKADYEDVSVARIGNRDVLAVGIQPCEGVHPHGLALYDVTHPTRPRQLSFVRTPPHGVHELDLTVRDDGRALVLATVPHSEREGTGGDVRIIDVTHPRHPVKIAKWGILADSSLPVVGGDFEITHQDQGIGAYSSNLAHGVRAADDGMTLYVSHWDAGVLKLDISDPANPQLVGRTTFDIDEDGDAHSAALYDVNGVRYILQNNEEISPLSPPVVTSSATDDRQLPAMENHFMPTPLSSIGTLTGEVFDANDGCEGTDFIGAAGKVALFDAADPVSGPPCELGRQVVRALRADVAGFLINFTAEYRPTFFRLFPAPRAQERIFELGEGVPSAMFSDIDGGAAAMRAALENGPVTVTVTPTEPSWGFLEVFSEDQAVDVGGILEFQQVGEFSNLRHVVGDPVSRRAWYTIHNTEVMGERAYSSWYGHGIVAIDVTDPAHPALVGKFTPRPDGPAEMWGVAVDARRGLVLGSDIRTGLWIVRPSES